MLRPLLTAMDVSAGVIPAAAAAATTTSGSCISSTSPSAGVYGKVPTAMLASARLPHPIPRPVFFVRVCFHHLFALNASHCAECF